MRKLRFPEAEENVNKAGALVYYTGYPQFELTY